MRIKILLLAAGSTILLSSGCGKQEATTQTDKTVAVQPAAAVPPSPAAPAAEAGAAAPAVTKAAAAPAPAPAALQTPASPSPATQSAPAPGIAQSLVSGLHNLETSSNAAVQSSMLHLQGATNQANAALALTNTAGMTVTNQVEMLLAKAKSLTANEKYQEALGTVTELYKNKLTPEQKQKVDDVKAQIQTALTQKASSSLGNILGGQK